MHFLFYPGSHLLLQLRSIDQSKDGEVAFSVKLNLLTCHFLYAWQSRISQVNYAYINHPPPPAIPSLIDVTDKYNNAHVCDGPSHPQGFSNALFIFFFC